MKIELDERLGMLADMVPVCSAAADVGTDHGFLGAWLLENKKCGKMLRGLDFIGNGCILECGKARRVKGLLPFQP